ARGLAQRADELHQILWLRRVGMVVGKGAVDLAIELRHLAAETPVEARRQHAGHAIAAIDRYVEGTCELHVARDALHVGIEHACARALARARQHAAFADPPADLLAAFAVQRFARADDLQAVVFRWVVAAAHGDTTSGAGVVLSEIGARGRRHADIDRIGA